MSSFVKEYKPDQFLSPFIEIFWDGNFNYENKHLISQQVLPNGYIELIIHLSDLHCDLVDGSTWGQSPDYTLIGLYTEPYKVRFTGAVNVFGIRFKPEGFHGIFGVPASEFSAGYEDMSLIAGKDFTRYCLRLRDAPDSETRLRLTAEYLSRTALEKGVRLSYVNHAAEIIRKSKGLVRIENLTKEVYISLRQLEREFKAKVGITPKHYQRIARLNEVHRLLQRGGRLNLTQIAHQSGYNDQAHFIRDFKRITGEKPGVFLREREQFIVNPRMAVDQ